MTLTQVFEQITLHKSTAIVLKGSAIVAGCVPLPGASAIPAVLGEIRSLLKKVKSNRDGCDSLEDLTTRYTMVFLTQEEKIRNSDLTSAKDEVLTVLTSVLEKARIWSSYGRLESFWKIEEISTGIQECSKKIEDQLAIFDLKMQTGMASNGVDNGRKMDQLLINVANVDVKLDCILQGRTVLAQEAQAPGKKETNYKDLILANKMLVEEGKRSDADLTLCGAPASRLVYNALALAVKEALEELHKQGKSYPVPNLGNKISQVKRAPGSEYGGVYTELYTGELRAEADSNPRKVALKTVPNLVDAAEKAARRFKDEIVVWSQLRHRNIDSLLGIADKCRDTEPIEHIASVAPWYENGNLLQHTRETYKRPNKLKLLKDAAAGMKYLHDHGCVHGKLKASNILITDNLDAVVSDFQMSILGDRKTPPHTLPPTQRWHAPELLEKAKPTFASDVWAFGMVMIEVFTGKRPFNAFRTESQVMNEILGKHLPPCPDDPKWITEDSDVWRLIQDCWKEVPEERPSFEEIHRRLERAEEIHDKTVEVEEPTTTLRPDLEPLDI